MKAGLSKKEQAERTRARVIDAAIALFAKRGFASTSTQDIARAIGMTPGVLYWHFEDKEALLIAVLDELQRRLFLELADEGNKLQGKRAVDTVRAMISRVAQVVAAHHDNLLLVGVIGAEATDVNPRVEKALREAYRQISVVVRALLGQAIGEGAVPGAVDLDCASEMFLGLYMGGVMHQRLFRDAFPLERAIPVLEQMLFAALFPAEAARSASKAKRGKKAALIRRPRA